VQALVEMSDLSTAQQMVDYYKHMPARIRSQPIHVQFSMHEHLKVSMFLSFASEQNCHSTGFFLLFSPVSCTITGS